MFRSQRATNKYNDMLDRIFARYHELEAEREEERKREEAEAVENES